MTRKTVLFTKCPLCAQAEIRMSKSHRLSSVSFRIDPCPHCSAKFTAAGEDNYTLVSCEPRKLAGNHHCDERIINGCYLDVTLSKGEWQRIAEGGESDAITEFATLSAAYRQGKLPRYPSAHVPFALEPREIVHYISSDVCLGEQQPSRRVTSDQGDLFLTNKRVVFVHRLGKLAIRLGSVERVEERQPGFAVIEKGVFMPHVFFPTRFDPIFAAVCGAIHNLKGKS